MEGEVSVATRESERIYQATRRKLVREENVSSCRSSAPSVWMDVFLKYIF